MNTEYVVVWDGTRSHPSGPYLFARAGSTEQVHPEKPVGESTRRIKEYAALLLEWRSIREIAFVIGMTTDQAHAGVQNLLQRELLEREYEGEVARNRGQRYRWARG